VAGSADACDATPVVVSNAPPALPLGTTLVTWTATDASGNRATCQEAVRVQDTTAPAIVCPAGVSAECPAQPVLGSASARDACDPAPAVTEAGPATFSLGTTTVVWRAIDASGNTQTCQQAASVVDTIPPTLTVLADPPLLWPPNHELVPVKSAGQVQDLCDRSPAVTLVSVTSSEPDDAPGPGDGSTTGDISGAAPGSPHMSVDLRAERDGDGPGRFYRLTYRAVDASGNSTSAFAVVTVPHDQGSGKRTHD
jgi:hypothetical protein